MELLNTCNNESIIILHSLYRKSYSKLIIFNLIESHAAIHEDTISVLKISSTGN